MNPQRLVAIYRRASFSPEQHRQNDSAILDAVVGRLLGRGWEALRIDEEDVEQGRIPAGDLYLNMCQGATACELLSPLEGERARIINRPSAVLNCHRHRMVRHFSGNGVRFPRTLVLPSAGGLPPDEVLNELVDESGSLWLKRGDVHAEQAEDVCRVRADELGGALARFLERGIPWVALQRHVSGPVLKFYGLSDQSFFQYYGAQSGPHAPPPPVDEAALRRVAFEASRTLGLEVFGGDVVLPSPDDPVLIDINDWPSFAPYRHEAAAAIAQFAHLPAPASAPT